MKVLKGVSIIELVIAGAIFIIFSSVFVMLLLQSLSDDRKNTEFSVATFYAKEGMEVVLSMAKEDFPSLGTLSAGGVEPNESKSWQFHEGGDSFGKFNRLITVEYANRNDGNISDDGSTDDKTMKISVTVDWESGSSQQEVISMSRYITHWNESL